MISHQRHDLLQKFLCRNFTQQSVNHRQGQRLNLNGAFISNALQDVFNAVFALLD